MENKSQPPTYIPLSSVSWERISVEKSSRSYLRHGLKSSPPLEAPIAVLSSETREIEATSAANPRMLQSTARTSAA